MFHGTNFVGDYIYTHIYLSEYARSQDKNSNPSETEIEINGVNPADCNKLLSSLLSHLPITTRAFRLPHRPLRTTGEVPAVPSLGATPKGCPGRLHSHPRTKADRRSGTGQSQAEESRQRGGTRGRRGRQPPPAPAVPCCARPCAG